MPPASIALDSNKLLGPETIQSASSLAKFATLETLLRGGNVRDAEEELLLAEFVEWLELKLARLGDNQNWSLEKAARESGLLLSGKRLNALFPITRGLLSALTPDPVPLPAKLFDALPNTLKNLLTDFEAVIDSPPLVSNLPREIEAYTDFAAVTEFVQIPLEFLDAGEGFDAGQTFARRWARRQAAKPSARSFLHSSATLIPCRSCDDDDGKGLNFLSDLEEDSNLCFDVRLPADIDPHILHQQAVFDHTHLQPEFLEASRFSANLALIASALPKRMARPLRNIDVFSWIPTADAANGKRSLGFFNALLLALGLKGHLGSLTLFPVDVHEILTLDSVDTSSCLLLGLALSRLQSAEHAEPVVEEDVLSDDFLQRLYSLHIPAFSDGACNIPTKLQLASIMGMGLLFINRAPRGCSLLMLHEVFRSRPRTISSGPSETPLLNRFAGLSLGCMLMGSLGRERHLPGYCFAEDIILQLTDRLAIEPNSEFRLSVMMATGLIGIGSGQGARLSNMFYWSRKMTDLIKRPEPLSFWSILGMRLVDWDGSEEAFKLDDQSLDQPRIDFARVLNGISINSEASELGWLDSSDLILFGYACSVLQANAFYALLRWTGRADAQPVLDEISQWMEIIRGHSNFRNTSLDYFAQRLQFNLLRTYLTLLLTRTALLAGSADPRTWALLRELFADPLQFHYGNGRLLYSAAGMLFMRGKKLRTTNDRGQRDDKAVVGLLLAFLPILPSSPEDAELSFLQFCEPAWLLASQQRQ
jgi:hypothetical protein